MSFKCPECGATCIYEHHYQWGTSRTWLARSAATMATLAMGGCLMLVLLSTGCVVSVTPADQLFGKGATQTPEVNIEKTARGFRFKSTKDVNVSIGKASFNPGTSEVVLENCTLGSKASPVLDKYPDWIAAMLPAQIANFQSANTRQQLVNDQIGLAYSLVNHLGDKFASVAPILWPNGIGGQLSVEKKQSPFDWWNSLPPEMQNDLLDKLGLMRPAPMVGPPGPVTP